MASSVRPQVCEGRRVAGQLLENRIETGDGPCVMAELQFLDGLQRSELQVVRLALRELLRLCQGFVEALSLAEHPHEIDAQQRVVRFQLAGALQQELGFLEGAQAHADVGQQAHCFRMMRCLAEKLPAQLLRLDNPSLRQEIGHRHQRCRQRLQALQLRGGGTRLGVAAQLGQELQSMAVAGDQRRVGAQRGPVMVNRLFELPGIAGEVRAFLQRAAVFRFALQQLLEFAPGVVEASLEAQAHRLQVGGFPVVGVGGEDRRQGVEGGREIAPAHVRLHIGLSQSCR